MNHKMSKKKTYQKPRVTKVELVAEEAFLTACKTGTIDNPCKLAPGLPAFDFGS